MCHYDDRSGKVNTSAESRRIEPDPSGSDYPEGNDTRGPPSRRQTQTGPTMTPAATAATLAALVDLLLPGDDLFPPASTVGAQALLAERIRQRFGPAGVADVVARLTTDAELPDALVRLELDDPVLFAFLYSATCFAYYQSPTVIAAIRALGHDYNDAPQPDGYAMSRFDFTPGINVPMNPRGTFKWTDWLEPVDISSLAHLNLPVKESRSGD
jgi:hypothetical protein